MFTVCHCRRYCLQYAGLDPRWQTFIFFCHSSLPAVSLLGIFFWWTFLSILTVGPSSRFWEGFGNDDSYWCHVSTFKTEWWTHTRLVWQIKTSHSFWMLHCLTLRVYCWGYLLLKFLNRWLRTCATVTSVNSVSLKLYCLHDEVIVLCKYRKSFQQVMQIKNQSQYNRKLNYSY